MNVRNFSLDFLQPSSSSRGSAAPTGSAATAADDPWAEAIRYYGAPVLKNLQEGGAKTVRELFETTKTVLKVPDLNVDQFAGVVWRMIEGRQLAVVRSAATLIDSSIALAIKG